MESSLLTTVLLPIALGVIMFGLGLTLTGEDFRRVTLYPRAVAIALVTQMILLPGIALILVLLFDLNPALGVGLMLLAASPGGATANVYSHLAKGDVALNITLTAINSVLSLFTLPLIVNFSLALLMNTDQVVTMQFQKVIEVFAVVLTPVAIGMWIRNRFPSFASRMNKPVKIVSILFLLQIIISITIREKQILMDYAGSLGLPVLVFNVLSMVAGYYIPQLFRVSRKQAIAIGMEIGIHNGTLAIYIALNVLNDSAMSVTPAIYSLLMFFTAAAFGFFVNLGRREDVTEEEMVESK